MTTQRATLHGRLVSLHYTEIASFPAYPDGAPPFGKIFSTARGDLVHAYAIPEITLVPAARLLVMSGRSFVDLAKDSTISWPETPPEPAAVEHHRFVVALDPPPPWDASVVRRVVLVGASRGLGHSAGDPVPELPPQAFVELLPQLLEFRRDCFPG